MVDACMVVFGDVHPNHAIRHICKQFESLDGVSRNNLPLYVLQALVDRRHAAGKLPQVMELLSHGYRSGYISMGWFSTGRLRDPKLSIAKVLELQDDIRVSTKWFFTRVADAIWFLTFVLSIRRFL